MGTCHASFADPTSVINDFPLEYTGKDGFKLWVDCNSTNFHDFVVSEDALFNEQCHNLILKDAWRTHHFPNLLDGRLIRNRHHRLHTTAHLNCPGFSGHQWLPLKMHVCPLLLRLALLLRVLLDPVQKLLS